MLHIHIYNTIPLSPLQMGSWEMEREEDDSITEMSLKLLHLIKLERQVRCPKLQCHDPLSPYFLFVDTSFLQSLSASLK